MNPSSELEVSITNIVEVNWSDRWLIYHRLDELSIPCQCKTNQPLRVEITNVTAAIQLWSVTRRLTAPRQDLIDWLKRCWK